MKLNAVVIVSWLIGNAQYVLGKPSGNVCQIPEGPFEKSCTNIAVEFCENNKDTEYACKLTADCDPYNHNEIFFPPSTTYINVRNVNGFISHPGLNRINQSLKAAGPIECNFCILPQGNYKESCTKISITYLPWLNDTEPLCLFQADCHPNMVRNELRYRYAPQYNKDVHNEAMLPKKMLFSDVKNLHGTLRHSLPEFQVTTDQCYERNSTEEVAMSKASRFNAGSYLTGTTIVAGLVLTI